MRKATATGNGFMAVSKHLHSSVLPSARRILPEARRAYRVKATLRIFQDQNTADAFATSNEGLQRTHIDDHSTVAERAGSALQCLLRDSIQTESPPVLWTEVMSELHVELVLRTLQHQSSSIERS